MKTTEDTSNLLDAAQVYPTTAEGPAELATWQGDVNGPAAIVCAIDDLIAERVLVARFALVHRTPAGLVVDREMRFGCADVDGVTCFRWCSADGNPDGCGSHSVIASWNPYRMDRAHLAAVIASHFAGMMPVRLVAGGAS